MRIGSLQINKNLILMITIIVLIISGVVGYSYINSDLNYYAEITAKKPTCSQTNLYDRLSCMATLDSIQSKYVSNNYGVNFSSVSSDTNGKGLYTFSDSSKDEYPVQYYRGEVDNNNVKFAGFCWKIVRTTETGGTKLIYNGTPDGNGHCTATEDATQLSATNTFNTIGNSLAYVGYMYGKVYEYNEEEKILSVYNYSFGSSFTFTDVDPNVSGDGTYTLTNTTTDISAINTHHYTCFNTTGTCSELYYIYFVDSLSFAFSISLKDGKSVEDAITEMRTNTNDSAIKSAVDSWFNGTFKTYFTNNSKNYNDYLEDTIWCNDRSWNTLGTDETRINNGWNPNGGNTSNFLYYNAYGRVLSGVPSLTCSSKNDSFTVTESTTGNGALTYPVGLLTADEIVMAGGRYGTDSTYYLSNNKNWWTMSPYCNYHDTAYEFVVFNTGYFNANYLYSSFGVRPSISLKHNIAIVSGDGQADSPYVIE